MLFADCHFSNLQGRNKRERISALKICHYFLYKVCLYHFMYTKKLSEKKRKKTNTETRLTDKLTNCLCQTVWLLTASQFKEVRNVNIDISSISNSNDSTTRTATATTTQREQPQQRQHNEDSPATTTQREQPQQRQHNENSHSNDNATRTATVTATQREHHSNDNTTRTATATTTQREQQQQQLLDFSDESLKDKKKKENAQKYK